MAVVPLEGPACGGKAHSSAKVSAPMKPLKSQQSKIAVYESRTYCIPHSMYIHRKALAECQLPDSLCKLVSEELGMGLHEVLDKRLCTLVHPYGQMRSN